MVTTAMRVAVATLCMGVATAMAQPSMHEGHHHGQASAARPDLGASATFDAQGILWAAYKQGGQVMIRRSGDAGRSWSDAQPVNAAPEAVSADGDARPKVAAGARGEIYVTWTQPLAKPYTGNIRFARSLDGGRTFAEPVTVHTDRREITHRFDAIAVNAEGQVFIAWIDKRDLVDSGQKPGTYRGAALYYAVSDDSGATFRGDFRAAEHICECCRIALSPQADGSVLAFWRHVFDPNVRDHAIARLGADGRTTDMRRATFDDWQVDACPHHGPSLALDAQGTVHAVWFTGAPGKEGVYYGRLGANAVEGQRRIGGDAAEHADIAAGGQRVALAWREFDGTRSNLRAMRSDDAGRTWRETTLGASEGASDHPKIVARGGDFFVFWNRRDHPLEVIPLP
jgi:hypothetical protein